MSGGLYPLCLGCEWGELGSVKELHMLRSVTGVITVNTILCDEVCDIHEEQEKIQRGNKRHT